MIVTKEWLNEFLDLNSVSTKKICKTLNSIGLEVDSLTSLRVPKGVVVGKVLECEKHPDADKLNICQVDLGSKTQQIVCGAKNVAKGQVVAVATVGADLGNGFIIKEAKLRGVESNGMICGSSEIGLAKINDGIWVLDESLGELELGRELCEFKLINDDVIEIELTANRGDCLSIYGVARDLSSALDIPLRDLNYECKLSPLDEIKLDCSDDISLAYTKVKDLTTPSALVEFRLGIVGLYQEKKAQNLSSYTTHATGVLLRTYNSICKDIKVVGEDGLYRVMCDEKYISIVGVNQGQDTKANDDEPYLLEASYIDPDVVSKAVMGKDLTKDELFYNSSRGSESDLEFGLRFFANLIGKDELKVAMNRSKDRYSHSVDITFSKINTFIGEDIDRNKVISILEKLRFKLSVEGDRLSLEIPTFRHDIINEQDVIEEIVRIVGIDNIASKPLLFAEKSRINSAYQEFKKRNHYRNKASGAGFYESIHYFFDSKEEQKKYGQVTLKDELDLTNPINGDLNTLRTSLTLHMLHSVSSNLKNGKNSLSLFEIGRVVDENRTERSKIAFIMSGDSESASVKNSAKVKDIDFITFATKVQSVIGDFKLLPKEIKSNLLNPYEMADIYMDDRVVGFMARVHIDVERDFDLPTTYICEIDFDTLKYERVIVKPYSKFPALFRDLSLLKPKDMPFSTIRDSLLNLDLENLINFYAIDLYRSKELGDFDSLTVRFMLQSSKDTMNEEQINGVMDSITRHLKEKFSLELR
jgi:phenylalanyl-tRNA synthetase beta chain